MGKPNPENLRKPWTPEEASYYGKIGGKKAGAIQKRKKAMRELASAMVNCAIDEKSQKPLAKLFPDLDEKDMTIAAGIIATQIKAALKGNLSAAKWLETLQATGELDVERTDDDLSASLRQLANELESRKNAG